MSRDDFLKIKQCIKYSKTSEKNEKNKIWRVRAITDIFRKNIQQFVFFSANMSVDESIIKFYGRCKLKQHIVGAHEKGH